MSKSLITLENGISNQDYVIVLFYIEHFQWKTFYEHINQTMIGRMWSLKKGNLKIILSFNKNAICICFNDANKKLCSLIK